MDYDDYLDNPLLNFDYDGRPLYYARDGTPLTFREYVALWGRLGDDGMRDNRRVASTLVGPVWVSTVWLGMNHDLMGGVPLIFETMTFPAGDASEDTEVVDRYPTEAAALAGHDQAVAMLAARYHVEPVHDLYPTDDEGEQ